MLPCQNIRAKYSILTTISALYIFYIYILCRCPQPVRLTFPEEQYTARQHLAADRPEQFVFACSTDELVLLYIVLQFIGQIQDCAY